MKYLYILVPVPYDISVSSTSGYLRHILIFYIQFLMTEPCLQHVVSYDIPIFYV